MKVRNDKDTTGKEEYKKIKLLESFRLQSSYNFFADSKRWSVIQLSARTKVFNEKVNINLTGTLDLSLIHISRGLLSEPCMPLNKELIKTR